MYKGTLILTTAIVATTTVSMFSLTGLADPEESDSRGIVGPDVVCWYTGGSGGLDMENYGSGGGYLSYAFGTTSCNWGDQVADWVRMETILIRSLHKPAIALRMVALNKLALRG